MNAVKDKKVEIEKIKSDLNEVIILGDVVGEPVVNHVIEDENGSLIDFFYCFNVFTKVITNKGHLLDESTLPILISSNLMNKLNIEIEKNKKIFIRGSFRTYEVEDDTNSEKKYSKQFILAHHAEYPSKDVPKNKYINRFNFNGFLLEKLYKPKFDKNNKPILNPKTRKPIPELDEKGRKQWTVIKKGKDVMNDFLIVTKRHTNIESKKEEVEKSFYIRCVSFGRIANQVATEIDIGQKISGSGYIRQRKFKKKGKEKVIYEAVVSLID